MQPMLPPLFNSTQLPNFRLNFLAAITSPCGRPKCILMRGHNLYGHLDGTTPVPVETITSNTLPIVNPNYVNCFRQDQLIQNAILASIDPTFAAIAAAAIAAKAA